MDLDRITLSVAALFLAGIVKGATGLGYSTTALPLLALVAGLNIGMPLVLLPSLSSNYLVLRDSGRIGDSLRSYAPLYMATLPGLGLGLLLLPWIEQSIAAGFLGIVLTAYAIFTLAGATRPLSERQTESLKLPVGAATGFINGLTGSQVMPLVPYLLSSNLSPRILVQVSNISFTISSLIMIVGLAWIGMMTWAVAGMSAACIVPALAGVSIGNRLRRACPGNVYRTLVLAVLLVMGISLALRALA